MWERNHIANREQCWTLELCQDVARRSLGRSIWIPAFSGRTMFRGCHSFPGSVLVSIEFHLSSLVILTLHAMPIASAFGPIGDPRDHQRTSHKACSRVHYIGRTMALTPDSSRRTCVSWYRYCTGMILTQGCCGKKGTSWQQDCLYTIRNRVSRQLKAHERLSGAENILSTAVGYMKDTVVHENV